MKTRNRIAITVKNKESLEVLKEAVLVLERVMNGEDIDKIRVNYEEELNFTEIIRKRLEEELNIKDVGPLYPLDRENNRS